MYKNIKIFK